MKEWLMNWVPLSVMILVGKQHTNSFKNLIAECAVTSGHFVNLSMATNKNSKPPIARGKGPRISSPQTENGQDKGIVWRA